MDTEDISTIAKNTFFLNISTIASSILSFILSAALARYLGKAEFGQYSFAVYFTGLFVIFADLGLSNLVVREVARDKKLTRDYLSSGIIIKCILSLFTLLLIFTAINLIHYSSVIKMAVYILGLFIILRSFGNYFLSIFAAHEKMGYVAFLTFFLRLSILICVILVIILKNGLKEVLLAHLIGGFIFAVLGLILIAKNITKLKFNIDWLFCKSLLKNSFPFALFGLFSSIHLDIDVTLLNTINGDIPTAYYRIALMLPQVFLFIPVNFTSALFPVFSRMHQSSNESLAKYYEKSFQFLLVLALPSGMVMTLLSDRIIMLAFGEKYLLSSVSLKILSWAFGLMFLTSLQGMLLATTNRQKTNTLVIFYAMMLNIILNLILMPKLGYQGASMSKLITSVFVFLIYFYIISKNIYRINLIKIGLKPVLATLLIGIFIYLFGGINLFLLGFFAVTLYLIILMSMKIFTSEDFNLLKSFFRNPR